jgi:Uma2 family endonuclease
LTLPLGWEPYRLTVDEYQAMVEKGILTSGQPLELIEGLLVKKMTKKPDHAACSEATWRAIHALLPPGWHVRIEKPVRIPSRESMPEPDVSVARGGHRDYVDRDPGPDDVALVVEIARSSVVADRALATTYAAGGIPVYWIVNVIDRQLEIYAGRVEGNDAPPALILPESAIADVTIAGLVVGNFPDADILPPMRCVSLVPVV